MTDLRKGYIVLLIDTSGVSSPLSFMVNRFHADTEVRYVLFQIAWVGVLGGFMLASVLKHLFESSHSSGRALASFFGVLGALALVPLLFYYIVEHTL